jgi:hypothetical protein
MAANSAPGTGRDVAPDRPHTSSARSTRDSVPIRTRTAPTGFAGSRRATMMPSTIAGVATAIAISFSGSDSGTARTAIAT